MKTSILKWFLDTAEIIDAFRVVPRILLLSYGFLVWNVVVWFMSLPNPNTQQTFLVTTVTGLVGAIIGLYQKTGRVWVDRPIEPPTPQTEQQQVIDYETSDNQ